MSSDIYTEAYEHFLHSGQQFEYGRPDISLKNQGGNGRTDSSRTEQDNDHDGRLGVDCSSLVWRGLKNAGYDVGNSPFTTSALFEGKTITPYAQKHFDTISAADAEKPNGALEPGDVLMFKDKHGTGQHVAIFKGYDKEGHIEFLGSQVSTGPKEVTIKPGGYWDGGKFEIVGALRTKPEFRIHEPLHGRDGHDPSPKAGAASTTSSAQPDSFGAVHTTGGAAKTETVHTADGILMHGDRSAAVRQLQTDLRHLGYTDAHGKPLHIDGHFGPATQAAVEAFQRDHHLAVDGKAGPKTLEVLHTQTQSHAKASLPGLDDPKNPDHALYEQALAGVRQLDAQAGRASDQHSANLAAALVVAAKKEGMTRIDHVALSTDGGSRVFAVQTDASVHKYADVPTLPSLNTPIDKSSAALQQMNQQQSQQPPTLPQAPAQAQPAPAMSR
jgi:peptidoglycan hydrolase-like protein with peptidoglycan-binding domain